MRILFINDVYTVGGATKALKELILALKTLGHEPIVCTSVRDSFNVFLDKNGIQNIVDGHMAAMDVVSNEDKRGRFWFQKRQWKYLKSRYRAADIISKSVDLKSIDLIHTNSARNDVGCILHNKYNIPHVMHIREFGEEFFSCILYMPKYYKYLNHSCNIILSVSNALRKKEICKGVSPSKIKTVYDGVDFKDFITKSQNVIEDGILKIVMVGGLCEAKGQHIAIKAISKLPNNIKSCVMLDFIGWDDPVYLLKLKRLVHSLQLQDQIHFLGEFDNIGQLLSNYNIGLNCSKCEGFGRVTVEYMFVGLGVIASDTGATPELVINGYSGLLYKRDDPNDLAQKICSYFCKKKLLSYYGGNAHLEAAKKFSLEKNLKETLRIYNKLLKNKR